MPASDSIERLGTRAAIMPMTGEMTLDRAVEIINANHARTPLTPEQIYVFRMVLSNQQIDSYTTRMSRTTLQNYEADFTAGRALMNSHRTSSWNGAELPIGRTFAAELGGAFLADNAPYEAQGGASLAVYSYIQRGLRITDVATDDLIGGIDGGTINDCSVGFYMDESGAYRCSLCGSNLMDYGSCTHVPGVQYDNGRCFAWVENARGREGSLVYMGATPGAMVDKAIRMCEDGKLSRSDALMLGDRWGVRIVGGKNIAVIKTEDTKNTERKEENTVNWEQFLSEFRATDAAQADRIAALEEGARLDALLGVIREQAATVTSLTPRAEMGNRWLDSLVDEAVKARVRAEGTSADKFDAEKWRKVLRATNDPEHIQGEIDSWSRAAKTALGDGKRPSAAARKQPEGPKVTRSVYK